MLNTFTICFVAALFLNTLVQFALAWRQSRSVSRHRAVVPAAFSAVISLPDHQKAADYTLEKLKFSLWQLGFEQLILLGFTLGGGIAYLYHLLAASLPAYPLAQGVALLFVFMLCSAVLSLPFDLYYTFKLEAKFNFNKMTIGLFFQDLAKQTALMLLLGVPLLFLVLWLMQKMGANGWLYVFFAVAGFQLLLLSVYPTFIAPLFNQFTPLADVSLRAQIEGLLTRCGFVSKGVFMMDGSKRSSHGNAYFTGFGANKRIVFFDTLLKTLNPAEIEAVLAHELGHFTHKHTLKRIAMAFLILFVALAAFGFLREQVWFYQGLGVNAKSDALALLLLALALPVFTFLLAPLSSFSSRKHEFEADAYAAKMTRAQDLISALSKLYRENANTLTPDAWYSTFYHSHPPAPIRVQHLQRLSEAGRKT